MRLRYAFFITCNEVIKDHNGEVVVMDPASGKILHQASMGEKYDDNTRASIAIADNQLFIRTNGKLYCVQ